MVVGGIPPVHTSKHILVVHPQFAVQKDGHGKEALKIPMLDLHRPGPALELPIGCTGTASRHGAHPNRTWTRTLNTTQNLLYHTCLRLREPTQLAQGLSQLREEKVTIFFLKFVRKCAKVFGQ